MSETEVKTERSAPWRENIEAMTMAIIMALFLKLFLVEAYQIPSGSMQPTLIGHVSSRGTVKDRILADKLSFHFRDPERFEVVIFRYPLNRAKNFVKRVVGLPGEYFRVWNGDLWRRASEDEPWEIPRRPHSVQAETWKRLIRDEPGASSWSTNSPNWQATGRALSARGPGSAAYRPDEGSIMDVYNHGYPDSILPLIPRVHQDSGTNPVGDLRLEGSVSALADCESIEVELSEGPRTYTFRIPGPSASPGEVPTIRTSDSLRRALTSVPTVGAETAFRLTAGRATRFAAQNLDDLLELEIDGEVVCSVEISPATDQSSGAGLAVHGEGADFTELMLSRDIYYTSEHAKVSTARIPDDSYFMLGDNTQNSSDSREWTLARYRVEDEQTGEERILRGSYEQNNLNPYVDAGDPEGPMVYLRDEWGERHRLKQSEATKLSPELASFVPRELILGRAVAVFWPLDPINGRYRWGWIH